MTNKILKTKNEKYGFFGTASINYSEKQTEKSGMKYLKPALIIRSCSYPVFFPGAFCSLS